MLQILLGWGYILIGIFYFFALYVYPGTESVHTLWSFSGLDIVYLSYVNAVIFLLVIIGVFKLIEEKVFFALEKMVENFESKTPNLLTKNIFSILKPAKYVIAFYIAMQFAELSEGMDSLLTKFFTVCISLLTILFITRLIKIFFEKKIQDAEENSTINASLLPFLKQIIIVLVWALGIISIASNLGYNVAGLLAGAGIMGLAIGLAAQKSIANIFGAITIFLNRPFQVGDFVKIGNHTGTVKNIGLSYISLSDLGGHEVLIPNENIISSSLENFSKRGIRKTDIYVGVEYETSQKKLEKAVVLIEEICEKYVADEVFTDYRVHFDSFGDFSLNIVCTYFTKTISYTDYLKEREKVNFAIKEAYEKVGISMAFPTQEVILKK